jgi:hypothetical protein
VGVVGVPGVVGVVGGVGVGVVLVFVPGAAASPEIARTSATPDSLPAMKVADAIPFRVWASTGSTRPMLARNRTVVPFGTGWPLFSNSVAVNWAEPPGATTCADAVSEIVELIGATSGDVSHPAPAAAKTTAAQTPTASNQ